MSCMSRRQPQNRMRSGARLHSPSYDVRSTWDDMYAALRRLHDREQQPPTRRAGLLCASSIREGRMLCPSTRLRLHASASDQHTACSTWEACLLMVTHLLVPGGQVSPCWEVAAGSFSGR